MSGDKLDEMWRLQAAQQRDLGMDPIHMNDVDRRRISADLMLSLHEEVGELQRATAHYKRHILNESSANLDNVAEEVADIVKLTLALAQLHGLDVEHIAEAFRRKTLVIRSRADGERLRLKSDTRLICVDMDDVICDLSVWSRELKALTGDVPSNGRSLQLIEAWKDDWYKSGRFRDLPAIEGAPEALRTLARTGHKVVIITARPQWAYKRLHADTLEWLKAHNVPHDLILFNKDKLEAIHEHLAPAWPIAFVEDHERNARHLSAAGVPVLLFDRPSNRDVAETTNITRVHSWDEILAWLAER